MRKVITMKGPVKITNLRNGYVRIEPAKPRGLSFGRGRMHIRTDEFMRLINAAPSAFGAL